MSTAFDALEGLDFGYHVDPKDRDPRPEEKRQLAFLRQCRLLCPAVIIFSVPNAGRRTQWEIGKAKREGLRAGVCDLVAVWSGGAAFIEMKNGTAMPSEAQLEFLSAVHAAGHPCGVFRQEASALAWLRSLGAPFIGSFF